MFYKPSTIFIPTQPSTLFQSLIGVLQTLKDRISENGSIEVFQSLIGVLQTNFYKEVLESQEKFQSLIGVLQTKTGMKFVD